MKSTDTNCRTCGAEYKNNPIILIIILIIIVTAIIWAVWSNWSQKKIEKEKAHKAEVSAYIDVLKKLDFSTDEADKIANLKYSSDTHIGKLGFSELKEYVASFNDQRKLSNNVMRVALAQPLSELQKIKRETESKKYTGCLEASKLLYVSSMGATNEALLAFLADGNKSEDEITSFFTKSILQEKEAEKVLTECETKNLN
ncbi:hypothetical protein [Acinetobacter guillouiae]|uniref:hypothetical protein n=1 Tax=Acinetobacter guillouiae TaxID=106649 RepID=UPI003AF70624